MWSALVQVLIHHQGDMLFKGVNQRLAIYQLTSPLLWHEVAQEATSKKAIFLSAGRGLLAILSASRASSHNDDIPIPDLIAALRRSETMPSNLPGPEPQVALHALLDRLQSIPTFEASNGSSQFTASDPERSSLLQQPSKALVDSLREKFEQPRASEQDEGA